MMNMTFRIMAFLAAPVAFDLLNCYVELRHIRRGKGASPVPFVTSLISIFVIILPPLSIFI
jgi:hypothetical protein